MIYVYEKYCEESDSSYVDAIYEVDSNNIEQEYKDYILGLSKEVGLVLNIDWLDVCCRDIHHSHLTDDEYYDRLFKWQEIMKGNTIADYIIRNGGEEIEYKIIIS